MDSIGKRQATGLNKTPPHEVLLVGCQSSEPYSVRVLEPTSGTSLWSLKGAGLGGGTIGTVEPTDSQHSLILACSDRPVVHEFSFSESAPSSSKSTLPGVISHLATHPSGDLLFGTIGNRLHIWLLRTGNLLSTVEPNKEKFTAIKVSSCGNFLASSTPSGTVYFYVVADLISGRSVGTGEDTSSYVHHSYSPHCSTVEDIHVTGGRSPRILSVSADSTAVLYSPCAKQTLFKVSADQPLTACCMDLAESRVFLGSKSGKICALDLSSPSAISALRSKLNMKKVETNTQKSDKLSGCAFYQQHTASITRLVVNTDGSRLASGDSAGVYCLWEVANLQCLTKGMMKGPIIQLSFMLNWSPLPENDLALTSSRFPKLRTTADDPSSIILRKRSGLTSWSSPTDAFLDRQLDEELESLKVPASNKSRKRPSSASESSPQLPGASKRSAESLVDVIGVVAPNTEAEVAELRKEVEKLRAANKELFDYTLQLARAGDS